MSFIRNSVIAGFFVGILVGAAALNLVYGTHIDNAELKMERLQEEILEQSEQIATLEKALSQHQNLAVTEIEVHVTFEGDKDYDEYTKLEIEKTVKDLLKEVRGKEVSSLDPLLVRSIIDGRTVEISKLEFILTVECMLVSERLIIFLDAAEPEKTVMDHEVTAGSVP